MATSRKTAGPAKSEGESRTTTYIAPGERPDPYAGNEPSLDPDLAKIRDDEAKKLAEVKIDRSTPEPTIDEDLVKAREADAKRGAKLIGDVYLGADSGAVNVSEADGAGVAVDGADVPAEQPAQKPAAKKAAAKKSSK